MVAPYSPISAIGAYPHLMVKKRNLHDRVCGEVMQRLRKRAGLSLNNVEDQTGIRRSTLSRRERGDGPFTNAEIDALVHAYGLDSETFENLVNDHEARAVGGGATDRMVPVIGNVPAGTLTLHWQIHDDILNADEWIDAGETSFADTVALRVVGRSMEPIVSPGAMVLCRPFPRDIDNLPLEDGDLVVVSVSDDAADPGTTLGYWSRRADGRVIIRKANPDYTPVPVNLDQVCAILFVTEIRQPTRLGLIGLR